MSHRHLHRVGPALFAVLKIAAFALAAVIAVAAAVVPNTPASVNLQQTLLPSPPGRWQLDVASSGPADEQRLASWGVPPAARRKLMNAAMVGYGRVWTEATRRRAVLAVVVQGSAPTSGAQFMSGLTESAAFRKAQRFPIPDVDGARAFVLRDPASGLLTTRVAFRRDGLAFVLVVVAANPERDLARTLAVAQDARAPAGDGESFDALDTMAHLLGYMTAVIVVYLSILGGVGFRLRRRRSRMRRTAGFRESLAAVEHVDVSEDVDLRRGVTRLAFTAKSAGAVMMLPLVDLDFWPYSVYFAAAGIVLFACGVGLKRGWRPTAARLLVLALSIVGIPTGIMMSLGALRVLRGQATLEAVPQRESRYRRLFTGKHPIRVGGLLAVTAVLTTVGLVAVVISAQAAAEGRESAARQGIGALVCVGLAVLPYRRARRHAALQAASVVDHDPRAPILYLRSFGDDRLKVRAHGGGRRHSPLERFGYHRRERFEEVIAGCLWTHGPVVAVGEPGERLAPLGAARTNFDDASWQAGVETWMAQAGLIVITVGRTEGLVWEVSRVVELDFWDRTILLFPPVPTAELDERWRSFAAAAAAAGKELTAELQSEWILAAAARDATLVAYQGTERDEWHYESALNAAASALLSARTAEGVAA